MECRKEAGAGWSWLKMGDNAGEHLLYASTILSKLFAQRGVAVHSFLQG